MTLEVDSKSMFKDPALQKNNGFGTFKNSIRPAEMDLYRKFSTDPRLQNSASNRSIGAHLKTEGQERNDYPMSPS
jgi:hypothetical protein